MMCANCKSEVDSLFLICDNIWVCLPCWRKCYVYFDTVHDVPVKFHPNFPFPTKD